MQEIKLYNSIGKNILYLLGCLIFVIGGIWMALYADETSARIVGIASILFFGFGVLVISKQVLDRRVRIIINDEGIFDRTLDVGVIEWRDIEEVYLQSVSGSVFIPLVLEDSNKYLRRTSKTKAKIAAYNEYFGFETVNLNLSGVKTNGEDILEIIEEEIEKRQLDTVDKL